MARGLAACARTRHRERPPCGRAIAWLFAHLHEGAASAPPALGLAVRAIARGRRAVTGAVIDLTVAFEAGAASFVVEPLRDAMLCDPVKRADADAFAANIAAWLAG